MSEKTCGTCSICCKIVAVSDLNKPAHQWCVHNVPHKGCGIWGKHPEVCKAWQCGWILMPQLDEQWKPERCGFIIRNRYEINQLVIDVDPAKPDSWRKEPFYSRIRHWAQSSRASGQQIMVCIGRREIAIFAEEDVDAGMLGPDEVAVMGYQDQGALQRPVVLIKTPEGTTLREAPGRFRLRDGGVAPGGQTAG